MTKTFTLSENLRRNIARFFLPIFTVWLIVTPSQSYAVAPLVVAPVVAIYSSAASLLAGASLATSLEAGTYAAISLIASVMLYFQVQDAVGNFVRVPTTNNPTNQVPAPVAPPSAVLTSIPTAYNFNICTTANGSNCFSSSVSFEDALQKYCASYGATATCISGVYPKFQGLSSTGFVVSKPTVSYGLVGNTQTIVDTVYALASASSYANSCPAGYSGNPCALVDARAASPDNNCDLAFSSSSLAVLSDPDCSNFKNLTSNSDGSLDLRTKDSFGRPVTVHFKPNTTGGMDVNMSTQGADSNGNTVNTNLGLKVGPDGVVSDATQTQTTPLGVPATSPAVNPATGTTTTPPSTDYARQGEVAAAAAPVTAELQKLNSNFTTVPTTDPLVPLSTDVPTFGSTFNNLIGFKLPPHTSACPTPSVDLSNIGMGFHTLNSHCNLLNSNSAPIRNSMIIVFLLSALFIVLRA